MKKTIIILWVCSFFACTDKQHKLDGVWEYSHHSFILMDSLPKSQGDSIIKYLTDEQSAFTKVLMMKNGQMKEDVYSEEGVYYFDKRSLPCTIDTIVGYVNPINQKNDIQDTIYFIVNAGFTYSLRYVDENHIEEYMNRNSYIGDSLWVSYVNIIHYNRLTDKSKAKEIKIDYSYPD